MLPGASSSICDSISDCVRQRLCLHFCNCLVNCLNVHPSLHVSQIVNKRPSYLWAAGSPSASISTSVNLLARVSISALAFKCFNLDLCKRFSQFVVQRLGLYLWQCGASCLILHFDTFLASLSKSASERLRSMFVNVSRTVCPLAR